MVEIQKLVEYANIAEFPMWVDGDKLVVKNGKNLPPNLKEQISIHKQDIMQLLEGGWTP